MLFDLRLGLRALRRQSAIALAAILTVGLAVAANTALFSVFDGLLFRPLPFGGADRMVRVELPVDTRRLMPREDVDRLTALMSSTTLLERRTSARPTPILDEGAANVQAWGLRPSAVSPGWFAQFGLRPVAGQLVDLSGDGEFLMGEDLWRSRYGADESLIGTPLRLPGYIFPDRQTTLAGIVPRHFSLPDGANVWFGSAPLAETFDYAHLAPGATLEQVRHALPGTVVTPFREYIRPGGARAMAVLLGATGLLLLVAWVQVAGLLFSRAAGRTGEVGVRLALGASRVQLVRQFAAEGALIAAAALVAGWGLTPWLTRGVVALLPEALTRGQALLPDLRAFAFSILVSIAGVLILALVPVDVVRRGSPLGLLRGTLAGDTGRGVARWRTALLVAQLAVTTVLLYMSGLAAGSVDHLGRVDVGFVSDRVVAFRQPPVTTTAGGPPGPPGQMRAFLDAQVRAMNDTYTALRDTPGVVAVAGGLIPLFQPMMGSLRQFDVSVAREPKPSERAVLNTTTYDYARVLGLTVVDGRLPVEDDLEGEPVALVNQTFARSLATRGPVLGQYVTANSRTSRVIGVIGDSAFERPDRPVQPMMFAVLRNPQAFLLVKLAPGADGDRAGAAVAATFERFWPRHPARNLLDVAQLADDAVQDYRARATMLALIGVLCLPIAVVGIAGAFSHEGTLRRRETAIRLAIGATPGDIRRAVLSRALRIVALALAIGIAGGAGMGRAMSAYLFGVTALDPLTIVAVAAGLVALGLFAAWVPGRRASRIDPAEALRES